MCQMCLCQKASLRRTVSGVYPSQPIHVFYMFIVVNLPLTHTQSNVKCYHQRTFCCGSVVLSLMGLCFAGVLCFSPEARPTHQTPAALDPSVHPPKL